ncbi:hypothetical protein ACHAWF_008053 [Thalassiosira exigua]
MIIAAAVYAPVCPVTAFGLPPQSVSSDRRSAIKGIAASLVALATSDVRKPAQAVAPFAPVDTLLPAARVKLTIDRAVVVATSLAAEENVDDQRERLRELEGLLLIPQNFNRDTKPIDMPRRPAQSYMDSYAEYRNRASILERPGALLVQNGEIDAWKRLKRQERAREDEDEVRRALNYYTSNLNFNPDEFVFTASKEERSKIIREDRIPDVKNVIASDMGLRYLLRNDILTACDDARAELRYLMRQSTTVDGRDLLELLLTAQAATNKWFE